MSRKRIAVLMLVGALGTAVVSTGVSNAAPGPYDQPPSLTIEAKFKVQLPRVPFKKVTTVGSESCGTGTCTLTVQKVFAAVRNSNKFKASIIAPRTLQSGQSAPIKVKLSGGAFKRLKNSKTGHGHAKFELSLASSVGYPTINDSGNARYQAKKNKP